MSGKYALVIGNTEYTDPGLAQLSAPGKDVTDFARLLHEQEMCAFDDVKTLLNQLSSSVIEAIDEFFVQRKPDDLLVLYFSGHGVKDEYGSLYLAFKNTIRARLRSTAIKADYIREAMDQSRSKRQVVILDCCNSGAFPQGSKAEVGGPMGMVAALQGYGRYVLTASDATQFAWEGDRIIGKTDNSLFTHFLMKGLDGEADTGDGKITVDELYDYVFAQISRVNPRQTPTKSASSQEGDIVLRQITADRVRAVALPDDIREAVTDSRKFVREGAVQQLAALLRGANLGLARSAREALTRMAAQDDSLGVREAAARALSQQAGQEQTPPPQLPVDDRRAPPSEPPGTPPPPRRRTPAAPGPAPSPWRRNATIFGALAALVVVTLITLKALGIFPVPYVPPSTQPPFTEPPPSERPPTLPPTSPLLPTSPPTSPVIVTEPPLPLAPVKLAISEVVAAPCQAKGRTDGPPSSNEYIELYNYGAEPVDVGGWWLATNGAPEPQKLISWDARYPGAMPEHSSVQTRTTIIPPHKFALILAPLYQMGDPGSHEPYKLPNGTIILTVANGKYLGNDETSLFGNVQPLSVLLLYIGTGMRIDRPVTSYGSPVFDVSPVNVRDDSLDLLPVQVQDCHSITRIDISGPDALENWRITKPPTPGMQ